MLEKAYSTKLSKPCTIGWAENACFFIKFQIIQKLIENLLIHHKKKNVA